MQKIHYYFFILSLIEIYSLNEKVHRIRFGLYNTKISGKDIINNIFNNIIYLNLSIGTSAQIVPFELKSDCQTFCVTKEIYNKNKSSSYEETSDGEINISYEIAKKGFTCKDLWNDNSDKKINFILGTAFPSNNQKLGIIGLRIPYEVQPGVFPFMHSLKSEDLINTFVWTLKFYDNMSLYDQVTYNKDQDNYIGDFIFGDEPSNYENDSKKYNEKEYYRINPSPSKEAMAWRFNFSNIYISIKDGQDISKIDYEDDRDAEIVIQKSFISGPQYFLYFMEQHFFQDLYIDGTCSEEDIDFYTYIECDSSLKLDSFPNITFEHRDFEYSFNLTPEDLFVFDENRKKYIYLIFIRDNSMVWELGTPFLRKFQFVFNEDLKTIGFYKLYDGNNNNKIPEGNEGNNSNDIWKILLIVFLSLIFAGLLIFLGMFLQRKVCNQNRKKRANELKDNFEYISENNDENGLGINSDQKIIKDD